MVRQLRDIKHLEEEPIGSLIWKFSIPAIVGMVANASYNVIDRIFVGRGVGTDALSAITLTFPILLIILAFCMLIGIGSTALVSIRLGEKNKPEAEHILSNALTLCILISAIIAIPLFVFLADVMTILGASNVIHALSVEYMEIIIIGIFFQVTAFSLNAIIRGEGNPRIAMLTMLIGAFLNIILDALFIFGFKMGIQGAALATVISQAVSMIWVLYYFSSGKSLLRFKISALMPNPQLIKGIFGIGVSPFLMHTAAGSLFFVANHKFLIYGGEVSVAAMGIANSIVMFVLMPIFGLNQGIQPIIGYNYGAKKFARVKETLKKGMLQATLICLAGFSISMLFANGLISMFSTDDAELMAVGSRGLRFFVSMMPLVGFQIILGAYFQAIGQAKKAMILTLTRQVIFLLPLMFILPLYFGLDGLWAFSPVADFLSAIIATTYLYFELKRLDKLIAEQYQ